MNNSKNKNEFLEESIRDTYEYSPSKNFINRIMQHVMRKRIYRSKTDKKIAGICGGLAQYFNIDSVIVRIAFFAMLLCCGFTALAYLVAWWIIPKEKLSEEPSVILN
jgi:phage shock protein C